jgi:cytokinin riboside 5'-monophosphate phosphoribohydrolase
MSEKNKINLSTFCSSKSNLDSKYYLHTQQLVSNLNPVKYNIVYGGGTGGIMGTVRKAWLEVGGTIISSNITRFVEPGILDDYLFDNIIDRQKKLVDLGDGYLVFPGGYGTHYEMLEVITANDIGQASKPVFILNIDGIFDNFITQINLLIKEKFITRDFAKLNIFVESEPNKLIERINNYFNP